MALYGSSIPLDNGSFVTTVICPNDYSHKRLMQAINGIVPEAGTALPIAGMPPNCGLHEAAAQGIPHHATEAPMPPHLAGYLDGREDDTGEEYDVSSDPAYAAGGSI